MTESNNSQHDDILSAFNLREEEYIQNSHREGRKFVGYLCLRTPVELIEALDAVPLRIVPRPGFDIYKYGGVRPDGCSFCRMIPSFLDTWHYPKLNAIIAGSCCDQMRRITDTLHRQLNIPVILYGAPRTWNSDRSYFLEEMNSAFCELAKLLEKPFSEETIFNKIKERNTLRNIIRELRSKKLLANALLHKISAAPLPPQDIVDFLRENPAIYNRNDKLKFLLAGSIPGIWEMEYIDESGAEVVADVTCLGDRVFKEDIEEKGNLFANLYDGYIENNLCPHRRPMTPLIDYMRQLAEERDIDGIIYLTLKYCHPWGLVAERIKKELPGYPILNIDDDFTSPAKGSFRTRVGAFVEMLTAKRLVEAS